MYCLTGISSRLLALGAIVCCFSTNVTFAIEDANAADKRPNILLVVVDDMGYSDPGCYGGEIETPNIDQLANLGVRFTQFYNCSRCCQTRASLLTGAYPHHVGMKEFGRTMNTEVPTLSENLRDSGYSTGMVGKWHLSELPPTDNEAERIRWMNHQVNLGIPFGNIASYPTRRGFGKFYGIIWGVVNHFDPFSLTEGEEPVDEVPDDYHMTDAISERAVANLREFAAEEKPFFLYVAYTAPHWPIHAREKDIAKYRGKYSAGWQALRENRFERQKEIGLFDESVALGELSGPGRDWQKISKEEREYLAEKMAVHAAMVDHVDQGMGRIVDQLRGSGQLENTIIFFLSDNGASPEIPMAPGYDRYSHTRDGRAALREADVRREGSVSKVGTDESYLGIGPAWASAVNTPLRYWKAESYDGGCRTPLIVHWPNGLMRPADGFVHELGHAIDIAPTCYALAEVTPRSGTLQDGISLAPSFLDESLVADRTLFFQHGNGAGLRRGKWKASKLRGRDWELFDAEADPGETQDLSTERPDLMRRLVSDWNTWQQN